MIFGAPPIVTNGLILNLDAGNSKSYPGTGANWINLSNNNTSGSLVLSPTFTRGGGGAITLNGTNQYIDCGDIAASLRGTQFFTIELFGKKPAANNDFHVGAWTNTNRQGWFLQWYSDNIIYFGVNNNTTNSNRYTLTYSPNFIHMVGVFDGTQASDTDKSKIFINGVQQNVTTFSTSPTTIPSTQVNFYIGVLPGYATYGANIMSIVRIYNRALSAQEIQQNYNALKSRYDIQPPLYESLTYVASANITLTNNGTDSVNMFKTSGTSAWDNHCYSATPFTAPCTIEFDKQAAATDNGLSYAMIGWNADPTTNASYTSLDHASYPYRTDTYSVYNNGTQVLFSGAWSTSNKFYIVYGTDGYIRHYNGSTLLYSANYGIGQTVYVDTSFYSVNATYGGFSNVRVRKSAWTGTNYGY